MNSTNGVVDLPPLWGYVVSACPKAYGKRDVVGSRLIKIVVCVFSSEGGHVYYDVPPICM